MRGHLKSEVEIQVAPMLDMAFQLLTFFILTYRPSPLEGQFSMNLLPAAPAIDMSAEAPSEAEPTTADVPTALRTLTTSLYARPDGTIDRIVLGEVELADLEELRGRLKEITKDKTLPFDQALIQAAPDLSYTELIKVIDVFAGPEINITKISFGELSEGGPSL